MIKDKIICYTANSPIQTINKSIEKLHTPVKSKKYPIALTIALKIHHKTYTII